MTDDTECVDMQSLDVDDSGISAEAILTSVRECAVLNQ